MFYLVAMAVEGEGAFYNANMEEPNNAYGETYEEDTGRTKPKPIFGKACFMPSTTERG